MRIMLAGLALLLAAAAAALPRPVAFRAEERVIFTAEVARQKWASLMHGRSDQFWTPSLADAEALEQRLPEYLRSELLRRYRGRTPKSPPLWERALGYKRQFGGIHRKGRRPIYAYFLCAALGKDWRTEPIAVGDGD